MQCCAFFQMISANADELSAESMKVIPIRMKRAPAILITILLSILLEMNLPKYIAMIERMVRAAMTPKKTIQGLYSVAKMAEAICVLSPHSERKIIVNPEMKVFLAERWGSSSASSLSPLRIRSPKIRKTVPEISFMRRTGTMLVTHEPTQDGKSVCQWKSQHYSQEQLKGILLSGKIAVIWIAEFCLPSQLGQQPLWNQDLFYFNDIFTI